MKIQFKKRKEEGLHCLFCNEEQPDWLYETSPIKGIVCKNCKENLQEYLEWNAV